MDMFAVRLKELRQRKGFTQTSLANHIGIKSGKQTISKWEIGKSEPTVSEIRKLAEALDTTAAYLLDGIALSGEVVQRELGLMTVPINEFVDLQRRVIKQMDEQLSHIT